MKNKHLTARTRPRTGHTELKQKLGIKRAPELYDNSGSDPFPENVFNISYMACVVQNEKANMNKMAILIPSRYRPRGNASSPRRPSHVPHFDVAGNVR